MPYHLTARHVVILSNFLPSPEWTENRQQAIAAMKLLARPEFEQPKMDEGETVEAFEARLDASEVELELSIDQASAIKRCLTWMLDNRKAILSKHLLPLLTIFEVT